jgi:hypothetical protein
LEIPTLILEFPTLILEFPTIILEIPTMILDSKIKVGISKIKVGILRKTKMNNMALIRFRTTGSTVKNKQKNPPKKLCFSGIEIQ